MIRYIVIFLVLAIVLSVLGFGGGAGMSYQAAWLIGGIVLILAILGLFGIKTPPME